MKSGQSPSPEPTGGRTIQKETGLIREKERLRLTLVTTNRNRGFCGVVTGARHREPDAFDSHSKNRP